MKVKLNKIPKELSVMLKKKKIPFWQIGIVKEENKINSFYIELIVKRPERYNNLELIKKIPKTYKGIKVKII